MKFHSPLIVVENMNSAREFYERVLGQRVQYDFGENVVLTGGFSLHQRAHFETLTGATCPAPAGVNFELYFEEEDFDDFAAKIAEEPSARLLHDVVEHPWGQRAIRFFDPDGHLIEVGEPMDAVVRRLAKQGLSMDEIVRKSQHPLEFVEKIIKSKEACL